MKTETLFSRQSDEWFTPDEIFEKLDAEFHFTLDPCATAENHKCEKWFSKEEDGLSQDWGGRLFSVTLPIPKLNDGWKKPIEKDAKITLSLCFFSSQERILNGFITTFCIGQR